MAYVFHEGNVWEEENLTSNVVTNRDYANGLQIEFIVTSTWSQYYLIEDALGSVRLVTGSTASSVFSSNYKPYGLNYGMIGSSEFMYTGKQNDPITGFYFYGARFYDPAIGRFISEDSLSGSITSPLSLNRYSYVEDNPESFNDPSGNVIAIPFGGQAYSIHPVAPVPAPTPPPAPAHQTSSVGEGTQPTNSNPSNSASIHNAILGFARYSGSFVITFANWIGSINPPTVGVYQTRLDLPARGYSRGESGAIVVTSLFFFGVGAAGAGVYFSRATEIGPVLFGAAAVGLFAGGVSAAIYTYQEGPNATPSGALAAGENGVIEVFNFIADHWPF